MQSVSRTKLLLENHSLKRERVRDTNWIASNGFIVVSKITNSKIERTGYILW